MSIPKSVVKIKKNGVEFVSSVDKANYYIFELARAALKDAGKYVCKRFRVNYYNVFKRKTGNAGNAANCLAICNKDTIYPRVQIGLRRGKDRGFYAYFQEFGTKTLPKRGILSKTVEENIDEIREIESKYLSAIEDEQKAKSLIDESEYEGGADE